MDLFSKEFIACVSKHVWLCTIWSTIWTTENKWILSINKISRKVSAGTQDTCKLLSITNTKNYQLFLHICFNIRHSFHWSTGTSELAASSQVSQTIVSQLLLLQGVESIHKIAVLINFDFCLMLVLQIFCFVIFVDIHHQLGFYLIYDLWTAKTKTHNST